jgi:hypothetical protein
MAWCGPTTAKWPARSSANRSRHSACPRPAPIAPACPTRSSWAESRACSTSSPRGAALRDRIPQLAQLAKAGAEIDGVAIRDRKDDLARFLAANGNPFARIGQDDLSKVQIGIGSSGVPETFVVDAHGVIRHQHIGAIMPEDVPVILQKLKEAEQ